MIVRLEPAQQQQWHRHVAVNVGICGMDRLGDYLPVHVHVVVPHQQEAETSRQKGVQELVLKI